MPSELCELSVVMPCEADDTGAHLTLSIFFVKRLDMTSYQIINKLIIHAAVHEGNGSEEESRRVGGISWRRNPRFASLLTGSCRYVASSTSSTLPPNFSP